MQALNISPGDLPPECDALRAEVRAFVAEHLGDCPVNKRAKNWVSSDPAFTRKIAERGWIGMTWPKKFGGQERSYLERYVVLEELLAAGAPMACHWVADRQSGPLLMRYAPDTLAPQIVPRIVRGEAFFCIGMSEPDAGSDLTAIRTRATRTDKGWLINGRKVWTSGAHWADYMIALVRTGERSDDRHAGMSQFLIDMKTPGMIIRPIYTQLGEDDFCEVTFDDVLVPHENLIGNEGGGWKQVVAELTFERAGPERFLSSTQLLLEMLDEADPSDPRQAVALGRVAAQYATLRQVSLAVALMASRNEDPGLVASVVKDQGALLEQSMPDIAHDLFGGRVAPDSTLAQAIDYLTLAVPSFSLRGGTREILRGIISKGLGLR